MNLPLCFSFNACFLKVNKLLLLIIHFDLFDHQAYLQKDLSFDHILQSMSTLFLTHLVIENFFHDLYPWLVWFHSIVLFFFNVAVTGYFLMLWGWRQPKQKGEFISYSSWTCKDRVGSVVGRFSGRFSWQIFLSFFSAPQDTCFNSSLLSKRTVKCARNNQDHISPLPPVDSESLYFCLSIPNENAKILCTPKVHAYHLCTYDSD